MRMAPRAPSRPSIGLAQIPPERLDRVRWRGEATYRVLSYYFSVRWNSAGPGERIQEILAQFAVPPDPGEVRFPTTPGVPPRYSLVVLRRADGLRYWLLFNEGPLAGGDDLGMVLSALFSHVNGETIRRSGDFLLVHAGAVVTPGGQGVLLPASSGSGKSTLVAGLVRAGFGYLSDEAGAIDPASRKLYPYPKFLTLSEKAAALFPGLGPTNDGSPLLNGDWYVPPGHLRPGGLGTPCDVRFVIVPRYTPGATTEVTPITPAATTAELLLNCLNLTVYRARALPVVTDVASAAQGYRLISGDLQGAVRAVVDLTGSARAAPTPSTRSGQAH